MHQGDPIPAFLFILALEVSFVLIKSNNNTKGLDICYNFQYTAYADDSSFFFKNKKFVIKAFKILDKLSLFFGLKLHKAKCEVAGIRVKKGVKVAFCGMKNIDLKNDTENYSQVIIPTTKNLKIKRILKIIYKKQRLF